MHDPAWGSFCWDTGCLGAISGCPAQEAPGGGFGQGASAGTLTDGAPPCPGLMEKKTNELLLMETFLRCPPADDWDLVQPFEIPLLSGTKLLRGMDPARLCPPPPALDSTDDTLDAGGCGRREGGAVATQPSNLQFPQGRWPIARCHLSSPANPSQPVPPHRVYKLVMVSVTVAVFLGSGCAAGPQPAAPADSPAPPEGARQ